MACSHTLTTHPAHVQVSRAACRYWRRGWWSSGLLSYPNYLTTHPAHAQVSRAKCRYWRRGGWSSGLLSYPNHTLCPRAGEMHRAPPLAARYVEQFSALIP